MSGNFDVVLVGTDPDVFEAFYREHVQAVQRLNASTPHATLAHWSRSCSS
ncbi:MAG TPA: hypothetical protein VFG72_09710 [Marmoricola sp.]|nr:hypothetical protein [Marmoricola sp.]